MSEAVANAAPTAAPVTQEVGGSGVVLSLEERANALFGSDGAPANDTPAEGQVHAAEVVTDDKLAAERAQRRQALERLKSTERERVSAITAMRERDELKKRNAELEAATKAQAQLVDPTQLDEAGFFKLAERLNVTPQKLGEWLRERMADPEAAAQRAATSVVDPKIAALEAKLAEQAKQLEAFLSNQTSAQQKAEEAHYAQQLAEYTKANAATSPLTARFAAVASSEEFYAAAVMAAERLPPHAGAQAILDEMEEALLKRADAYRAIYAPTVTNPQRAPASPPPQHQAAAMAPTHVSNTLAQQRSSVVDEQADFASLPIEERASRIFG